jgi:serine phosphatase RsbU (regulator of sigma subunit)
MATKQDFSVNWESELNKSAFKFHVLVAWVAVILNPIWVVGDYLNIPNHFWDFFAFRIVVSALILGTIIFKKHFLKKPQIIALVPFIGISIQNSYMYSVMTIPEIQQHTFAYIALFIGAGMFVLWKTYFSLLVFGLSFLSNIVFFTLFGKLKLADVMINGGLLTLSVAVFTILLIKTRTNLVKKEIISRLALMNSNIQLENKNVIIEAQNKDIKDSLNYAKRIQHAILPPIDQLEDDFKEYFILYKPKDIVSGDFYWYSHTTTTPKDEQESEKVILISAVDCTGHGVPGALMSIIGNAILNQSLKDKAVNSPADALSFLNSQLAKNLTSINDGMDIALCAINKTTMKLYYAGANNPIYIIRKKELIEIKADKQAIGAGVDNYENKSFTNHVFDLQKDDSIYLFTDGYADQFGGSESYRGGKKFKYRQFKELLVQVSDKPMKEQEQIIFQKHLEWKGNLEQVDDILIIGFKI